MKSVSKDYIDSYREEINESILMCEALITKANTILNAVEEYKPQKENRHAEHEYINHPTVHFWQLTANLYINECILGLAILLDPKATSKKTITNLLPLVAIRDSKKAEKDLQVLISYFLSSKLLQVRHNFIAHRSKSPGSRLGLLFSQYKKEHRDSCNQMCVDLNKYWGEHLGIPIGNNYFLDKLASSDQLIHESLKRINDN